MKGDTRDEDAGLNPNGGSLVGLEFNEETDIYRSMKKGADGNWIQSPMEGASNSSQLGVRTPKSVGLDLQGNQRKSDIEPQLWPGSDGSGPYSGRMVGFPATGIAGLSASMYSSARKGDVTGMVRVKNLPVGLRAINDDKYGHVSIFPAFPMTLGSYMFLLNRILWSTTNTAQ